MRTTLLCLLAALAANALFGWWGRSTFVPLGLVVVGGLLLSILLGVLAAVIHGFSKRTPDRDTRLTLRMLLVGVVFFSSTLLGLPVVQRLIKADVAATRTEVENLAAALERYHTQHGRYPEALDERILTTPHPACCAAASLTAPTAPAMSSASASRATRWRARSTAARTGPGGWTEGRTSDFPFVPLYLCAAVPSPCPFLSAPDLV